MWDNDRKQRCIHAKLKMVETYAVKGGQRDKSFEKKRHDTTETSSAGLGCLKPGRLDIVVQIRCHASSTQKPSPFIDKRYSEFARGVLQQLWRPNKSEMCGQTDGMKRMIAQDHRYGFLLL